ncbi:MAG: ATP synthase F1 subunit delta [Gemmatimonadota bacterium]
MRPVTVARGYADALLALALREGEIDAYSQAIHDLAELLRGEPSLRRFLETPRVRVSEKKETLRRAFGASVPERFLRFLYVVLDKGRQRILPHIATEFGGLVDTHLGRVHVEIVLAMPPDDALRKRLVAEIEKSQGRAVVPRFRVDPEILGGLIFRVGDRVMDGSLRRRLSGLRKALLAGDAAAARA